MPNEPIGKGRRAIFGEAQTPELKDKAQEDLGLSLKDKGSKAEGIKPENQETEVLEPKALSLKGERIKPEALILKEGSLMAECLNLKVLHSVINDAQSSRKTIAIWSPTISAALWYLKTTTPMYSISDAAKKWVEDGLERDYPELMKKIREEIRGCHNKG
jgi:hypothetical protein